MWHQRRVNAVRVCCEVVGNGVNAVCEFLVWYVAEKGLTLQDGVFSWVVGKELMMYVRNSCKFKS